MRVAVVPSAPALLPAYAGLSDPLAEVRAAALDACRWLTDDPAQPVTVLGADPLAGRVGRALLLEAGLTPADFRQTVPWDPPEADDFRKSATTRPHDPGGSGGPRVVLVVADGSARRGEKAPGHLDERAHAYDAGIGRALAGGDAQALAGLDPDLGAELLAAGVPAFRALGALAGPLGPVDAVVDYEGDPFGVAYWVVRWTCGS